MLSFEEFFVACSGVWTTERTYHYLTTGEVERSYTEFRADPLALEQKQQILQATAHTSDPSASAAQGSALHKFDDAPGFAISFETRSEKGEEVSMQLRALFLPATDPIPGQEIRGEYLRDKGYSETGAIIGQFYYRPERQALEMTTAYSRSISVDQMRFVRPDLRLRTIITYERPPEGQLPSLVQLVGFGVERKQAA
ncbi:phycobiliprotein lyase [Leptolyngbya sp. FACHB-261]|uniref:phycobiliprotein lyase n=1 Tax=Leptolyngbya sp. FACHB-261 TaxID=2692806 RepID=UPI001682FCE4|nr:phycobiliprotein lyase [Leptolyngbya sp. FACHB-261]MBD2101143.1 phycobiliprotein lyase [Leptolyngbya sp. FACHB-261]